MHKKKKISRLFFQCGVYTLSFSNIMYQIFDVTDGCGEPEILEGGRAGCTFCISYQELMPFQ